MMTSLLFLISHNQNSSPSFYIFDSFHLYTKSVGLFLYLPDFTILCVQLILPLYHFFNPFLYLSLSVQFAQSISLHLFLPNLIPFFSSLFLSSLILYFYFYLSILHPISTHQHHPNFCTNHSISTPTHFSLTLFLSFSLHLSILHLFSVSTFSFKADATRINEWGIIPWGFSQRCFHLYESCRLRKNLRDMFSDLFGALNNKSSAAVC